MNIKKMTQLSLLTATALIIFIIELRIPNILPIYGVKLGLANIITVFAVYKFKARETAMLVVARVVLGSVFSGNISSLLYSATGAMFCLCGMLLVRKLIPLNYIWISSIIGAILHNTGQIIVAMLLIGSSVIAYYPILIVTGSIAGCFTGLCAQLIIKRCEKNTPI